MNWGGERRLVDGLRTFPLPPATTALAKVPSSLFSFFLRLKIVDETEAEGNRNGAGLES
jgi:hypothetical protein